MRIRSAVAAPVAFVLVCFVPIVASCGGGGAPPAENPANPTGTGASTSTAPTESTAATTLSSTGTGAGTAGTATPTPGGPTPAWSAMSHDQKLAFMQKTFYPKMKDEFASFNSGKYGDMNCTTCHGDGVKDHSFKMPNAKLPKLNPDGGFKKHMDKTPEITKFMMSKVVPDAAALIGEQPYDPKTQKGFGCFDCHTQEGK
jgi:hypothetical protein